ncbi:glutamyl-tRNA reductase [Pontibacter sp. BT310]|uniref:Glutamyl-tRNA reductase n=1 Tax=Pontibacter populi TaxID=890055 RepID=A0ABS6XEC5_9BACT|nr:MULTISPECIES: glutamyl-tRNA reductase [Pontibacter]MBJ6119170.1 glutamyl-tRNA reductase [Pontibacter sp. BT310]MBR0571598.1 glutamyl-tRNA reductase [Microvirga sp. STS03]MBW3366024.1 glutamyl-tRNA reductase [Pontibacter populi]
MQNNFKALTLSYKHAPINVREAVALNEIGCRNLLDKIKEFTDAQDVLVLSTCNRTEVYYSSERELDQAIIKLIAMERGFISTKKITPYFKHITDPELAVQHLFYVGLGLESQVVGDMQILNQVKKAYQWSAEANMAGPFLHRLLHTIFSTNKQVFNETSFFDGAASVSYATVELVEELITDLVNPRVLMIGVGEIGANVCDNFQKSTINNVVIVNRTHHKAQALAEKTNAIAVYWENVWEEIAQADVVISSVPGDCFFISKEVIAQQGVNTPKFFLDLSMPRSIDSTLEEIAGVEVYNVDTIKNRASEALEMRMAAIPQVQQIIAAAIVEFSTWTREMAMSPALQQFKSKLEEIRQQELNRYMKNLGEAEREVVEKLTQNILNKIVKLPALELKAACMRGESEALVEGLAALFSLEKDKV